MIVKIAPCRKCGSTPYFKPYEQSIDRNHDTPASVTCRTCGRSTVMDWNLWFEVEEEVGDEKYAKQTAYLSARFMDALGDARGNDIPADSARGLVCCIWTDADGEDREVLRLLAVDVTKPASAGFSVSG